MRKGYILGKNLFGQLSVQLLQPVQRLPATPVEHLAVSALKREGAVSFDTLVKRVSAELDSEKLRDGAWAVDIGLFGSRLFTRAVTRELKAGDGILWEIKQKKGNA